MLLFPSFILLHAIAPSYEYVAIITQLQKHIVKTIHETKIVSSSSNKIVTARKNDWSVLVKVLVWVCFSRRACLKETEHSEWFHIQQIKKLWTNNVVHCQVQTIHPHLVKPWTSTLISEWFCDHMHSIFPFTIFTRMQWWTNQYHKPLKAWLGHALDILDSIFPIGRISFTSPPYVYFWRADICVYA